MEEDDYDDSLGSPWASASSSVMDFDSDSDDREHVSCPRCGRELIATGKVLGDIASDGFCALCKRDDYERENSVVFQLWGR